MYTWLVFVAIIVFATGLLIMLKNRQLTEGFDTDILLAQRQQAQFEGAGRYNDLARLTGMKTHLDQGQVEAALGQAVPVPTQNTSSLLSLLGAAGNFGAAAPPSGGTGVEQTGALQQKIDHCESLTTANCQALSDPAYTECGFCHRDGVNSKGKAHRGGMFISSDDQIRANERANGGKASYQPTIGTCRPANFTMMTDTCTALELKMGCQKAGAATAANQCGQCFGSAPPGTTGLVFVGPKPRTFPAILYVSHPGMHSANGAGTTVKFANGTAVTLAPSNVPLCDPKQITLDIAEGDTLTITVNGCPSVWCGWLSSPDGNRAVSLDIGVLSITPAAGFEIAGDKRAGYVTKAMTAVAPTAWASFQPQVPNSVLWYKRRDEVVPGTIVSAWYGNTTQGAPGAQGADVTYFLQMAAGSGADQTVDNQYFQNDPAPNIGKHLWITQDNGNVIIIPEHGPIINTQIANSMTMIFQVPATLIDPPIADDKIDCPNGPLVYTEVGAGLMGSHSCFKADGSFNPSLYCMSELFQSAGGTPKGTLMPTTEAQANALAVNNSLDDTVAYLNNLGLIATYGTDQNGAPQDFAVIKDAALKMLGLVMNNPCEGPNSAKGPYSAECLDYLWRTSGNPGQDAIPVDPTSLPYAACSATGAAAPLNGAGNLAAANAQGSIPGVRAYFQSIYNRANDSSPPFDAQAAAMKDCYNVTLAPPAQPSCPKPPAQWQCFVPDKLPSWISPGAVPAIRYEPESQQVKCLASADKGTCKWFPDTQTCNEWVDSLPSNVTTTSTIPDNLVPPGAANTTISWGLDEVDISDRSKGDVIRHPSGFIGYNPKGSKRVFKFTSCDNYNGHSGCDSNIFQPISDAEFNERFSSYGINFNANVGAESWNYFNLSDSPLTNAN